MLNQRNFDSLYAGFQKSKTKVIDTILKQVPDDVAEHMANSEKEFLMAMRSVIDRSIDKVDEGVDKVRKAKSGPEPTTPPPGGSDAPPPGAGPTGTEGM
jgi:hypothetical protein